jgi:uncharacterized iron-regulated protein
MRPLYSLTIRILRFDRLSASPSALLSLFSRACVSKPCTAIIFLMSFLLNAQEQYPKIYDSNSWNPIGFEEIAEKFKSVDVLIIGEEHDDKKGHEEKEKLIRFLSERVSFIISMEMFERDGQIVLNEYLAGLIDEKLFQSDSRLWNNYEDYKPIVLFAKANNIPILAANAPRRYVRMLSRNGLDEIYKFPKGSRKYFAPIYSIELYRQESYENKIFGSIAGHGGEKQAMKNMILAQNLWDATMTDSILKTIEKKRTKVLHINGRFHSDEYMGVTHRLTKLGLKVLTISMFVHRSSETPSQTQLKKYADIIYITGINKPVKEKGE